MSKKKALRRARNHSNLGKFAIRSLAPQSAIESRPYPNEHACRLVDPAKCDKNKYVRVERKSASKGGKVYSVIRSVLKATGKWVDQAYRYPKKNWAPSEARSHCKDHKGTFEQARDADKRADEGKYDCECIKCHYTMKSDQHCATLKCPKCGGQMRRKERPGPGQPGQKNDEGGESGLTVRAYTLEPRSLNEEDHSVETVMASEQPTLALDLRTFSLVNEILLMSGARMPKQIPLLDSHDRTTIKKQLGSTRDIRIEGDKLIGRDYFSSVADAQEAFTKIREGHVTDHSIGYRVHKSLMINPGKSAEINGRKFTASAERAVRVTTDWEPKENSVCPVGADVMAKVRSASDAAQERHQVSSQEDRDMDFEKWLEERGFKLDDLGDAQRAALEADYKAEQERAAADASGEADATDDQTAVVSRQSSAISDQLKAEAQKALAEARKAEGERVAAIRADAGEDIAKETVEKLISSGASIETARAEFLKSIREARASGVGAPAIHTPDGNAAREDLEAALLLRAAEYDKIVIEDYGEERAERARRFRDLALVDVCRLSLQLDGRDAPLGREEMIRAAFSTASLPQILGAVANKALLKGYKTGRETWRSWCSIGSVADFKTQTRARLTDTGELEEVNNAGEVAHGGAEEEYEQFNIATYAKQFNITRQNVINDDLGVFTRTPQRMGRAASLLIAKLVYTHLLANAAMQDGTALFHADHDNLNTTCALGTAGKLGVALQAFRNMTDKNGDPIDIEPAVLLVPTTLEETAAELMISEFLIATGSTDSKVPSKNIYKGRFTLEAESRLENSTYTGYSTSTWFLMGNPSDVDTIEVAFLNGKQEPTIERFGITADINVLGIGYRVYLDVGCKSLDFRGMQKCTA